jgi:fructosamine-3-kinase
METAISRVTGASFVIRRASAASGGCIHSSWVLESNGARYFAKTNDARFAEAFAAEEEGLAALDRAGMCVPKPVARGMATDTAFLVLDYLDLGHAAGTAFRALGAQLARLHGQRGPHFGWPRDNFIGLTPQPNSPCGSWTEFWQTRRLGPQLERAQANGHGGALQSLGARVLDAVPRLLAGHDPAPALLHGDLWGGNAACLRDGTPVVFDPAVYYGDPEADLAMTELFGGFPESFYAGYRELRPVAGGYRTRRVLYNLYHVLNHLNLFGGGYAAQAERMMAQLLDAAGRSEEKG